jgi:hypothetical protein
VQREVVYISRLVVDYENVDGYYVVKLQNETSDPWQSTILYRRLY